MNLLYAFVLLFLFSCSNSAIKAIQENPKDDFDKIILSINSKSIPEFQQYFGAANRVVPLDDDQNIEQHQYDAKDDRGPINLYIDKRKHKIISVALFYWKNNDNYHALKKRFSEYRWVERSLTRPKDRDTFTAPYEVYIPDVDMTFVYDELNPKRQVMWIYFN